MNAAAKIYISVPVNISRNIIMSVRDVCPEAKVFSSSKKYYADDLVYLNYIRSGEIDKVPDVFASIHPEMFAERKLLQACGHFDVDFRYETSGLVTSSGLADKSWTVKPVYLMPLIIFYNTSIANPPQSWAELMDDRFKGKILCTHEQTPPAILLKKVYQDHYPDGLEFVEKHVHYRGLPIDVNKAVGSGEYDVGVMPVSFARFSRNNSANFVWPEEGALPLLQMMIIKKGCNETCRKAAEHLLSDSVQTIFSQQAGFLPVSPRILEPEIFEQNKKKLWVPYRF